MTRRGARRWWPLLTGAVAVVVAVVVLVAMPSGATPLPSVESAGRGAGPPGTGWHLAFDDEFDGQQLDTTKWIPCISAGWHAEDRQTCPRWGTEMQHYQRENVSVADGLLRLTAAKAPDGRITSGSISNAEDAYGYDQPGYRPFSYTYGYFEVRMRVPDDPGLWTAVWSMPVGGGAVEEMDLFELMGTRDDPERIKMTLHGDKPSVVLGQATPQIPDLAQQFHVFGADWAPDHLDLYADGKLVKHIGPPVPARPHFIQANLAVGGEFVPPVRPDQPFPQVLEIDYLRVFQRH